MSFTDLERRRSELIRELNNPNTSAERLEVLYRETQELRSEIDRYNGTSMLEGATLNPDRIPRVMEVVGKGTTENSSVDYVQDTSAAGGFGGVAAETGEGVIKPEATGTFAQKTMPVRTIANTLPVTRQAMDDNKQL